jgi:hypothetical protein
MRVANPKLFDEIVGNRASMSDEPYIVYCANCREVFASRGKECAHILDVALGLPPDARVPDISQKRANALALREEFMQNNPQNTPPREAAPWEALTLSADEALRERLDRELISLDDIKEAIHAAEASGAYFVEASGDARVCSLSRRVLTYWTRYRPLGDGKYEVLDAYYHRMRFETEGR